MHATRWLSLRYSFSAVGRADDSVFFRDDYAGGLAHFRHHYFALFMVALFHRASLLRYKHALSEHAGALYSSANSDEERSDKFHTQTVRLQRELMRFRSVYWFSEVSNQIQGQELFRTPAGNISIWITCLTKCAAISIRLPQYYISRPMIDGRKRRGH